MKAALFLATALVAATPTFAAPCPTDEMFTVSGGRIIGPNGAAFNARGVNIYAEKLMRLDTQALPSTFQGINFVRVNVFDMTAAASSDAFKTKILELNAMGIVTEIEDHNYPTVLSGSNLAASVQAYTTLATQFKGDGLVIFGTQNEPSAGDGSIDEEISAIYKAIRSTGNKTLILINPYGGYSTRNLSPDTFAGMTNVAWDLHYYNWIAGNSTSTHDNLAALLNEIASVSSIKSADGVMPVVVGEYGNAGMQWMDPGGKQVVEAVHSLGIGSVAWAWQSGNSEGSPIPADLLNPPWSGGHSQLTPFGKAVADHIASTGQTPACPAGVASVQPVVGTMTTRQAAPALADLNSQLAAANADFEAAKAAFERTQAAIEALAAPAIKPVTQSVPVPDVTAPKPQTEKQPTPQPTPASDVTAPEQQTEKRPAPQPTPVPQPIAVPRTQTAPAGNLPTSARATGGTISVHSVPSVRGAGLTPSKATELTAIQQQVSDIATDVADVEAELADVERRLKELAAPQQ